MPKAAARASSVKLTTKTSGACDGSSRSRMASVMRSSPLPQPTPGVGWPPIISTRPS